MFAWKLNDYIKFIHQIGENCDLNNIDSSMNECYIFLLIKTLLDLSYKCLILSSLHILHIFCSLLVQMRNGTATMKNPLATYYKVKHVFITQTGNHVPIYSMSSKHVLQFTIQSIVHEDSLIFTNTYYFLSFR